ncbi:MAG TPA: sodium:proton antiporter [Thermoanaerobaculia bacterium]|nr:sodium:proton antiporter [Thermoanaerobaculia bacterium]
MSDVGLFVAVLFAYSLLSRRLERLSVSAPMVFVAAGIALGPHLLGWTSLELTGETGLLIAEVALVVVLFADASRVDLSTLRENSGLPARLLGIGMPLTIALGTAAGALLLTEIEFWEAAMIAAVLAPTDAALGQAVVSSERVPKRIRQAINVESGLNDGLSIPFLFLFTGLALSEADVDAAGWLGFAAEQIGIGALVGVGIGLAGGWLVDRSELSRWITPTFGQISMLALALGAWALAGELSGNGFIAAFTAGLAAGRVAAKHAERILDFTEDEGQLLNLGVFYLFGISAVGFLEGAGWEVYVFGLLSLTVVRMLPVALALATSQLRPVSVAFVAWFGPRGLASIILALVVLEEEPDLPAIPTVFAAMTATVLFSVFAHGVSARPLTRAYGRRIADAGEDEAEMRPAMEMPVRGKLADPVE